MNHHRIWQTVLLIPQGRVAGYGQVADLAGLPGRARMVGKALGEAPAELEIPWHRVLRSGGQIAFPAGSDKAAQQKGRLQEEGVAVLNNRVKMAEFQWWPDLATLLLMEY